MQLRPSFDPASREIKVDCTLLPASADVPLTFSAPPYQSQLRKIIVKEFKL